MNARHHRHTSKNSHPFQDAPLCYIDMEEENVFGERIHGLHLMEVIGEVSANRKASPVLGKLSVPFEDIRLGVTFRTTSIEHPQPGHGEAQF